MPQKAVPVQPLQPSVSDGTDDVSATVTVSVGVAAYPNHAKSPDDLIKRADQALHLAKVSGRNRVKVWDERVGEGVMRADRLAGIFTGDPSRDYRNVSAILELIMAVSTMEVEQMLARVVDTVVGITGAERGILLLRDKKGELQVHTARDRGGRDLPSDLPYSTRVLQRVVSSKQPTFLEDASASQDTESDTSSILDLHLRKIMCVPLLLEGRAVGVIYADSRSTSSTFDESAMPLFEALAMHVGVVIQNAGLL